MSTELAWAAGFFDGEGWTTPQRRTLRSGRPVMYIQIGVSQVDRRPLERFAAAVRTGNITRKGGTSPCLNWRCSRFAEVLRVMDELWPYLSEPKREQFSRVRKEQIELSESATQG